MLIIVKREGVMCGVKKHQQIVAKGMYKKCEYGPYKLITSSKECTSSRETEVAACRHCGNIKQNGRLSGLTLEELFESTLAMGLMISIVRI